MTFWLYRGDNPCWGLVEPKEGQPRGWARIFIYFTVIPAQMSCGCLSLNTGHFKKGQCREALDSTTDVALPV